MEAKLKLVITLTQDDNTVVSQVSRPIVNGNLPRVTAALRDRLVDPTGPAVTDVALFQRYANDVVERLKIEVQRYEAGKATPAADSIG